MGNQQPSFSSFMENRAILEERRSWICTDQTPQMVMWWTSGHFEGAMEASKMESNELWYFAEQNYKA